MDHKGQRDPSAHLKEPHFEEVEIPLSPVFRSPKEERLWEYPVSQEQLVTTLTWAYAHSLSQLPIFHSLPLTTKRKPRIFTISEETFVVPSLEDIVLESLPSIDTPWEEILEDSSSIGNPWLVLENPSKECSEETFNQNILIHNMGNDPPPGGNPPLPHPQGRNHLYRLLRVGISRHLLREYPLPGSHRMP